MKKDDCKFAQMLFIDDYFYVYKRAFSSSSVQWFVHKNKQPLKNK